MKKAFVLLVTASLLLCALVIIDCQVDMKSTLGTADRVIVVDAGHGGEDGGASSADGILEKDLNLLVAQRCEMLLGLLGENVNMTRTRDESIDDGTGDTIAARKAADIRKRTSIANNGDMLVSIHMNSFPNTKFWGAQCFYAPSEGSRELGQNLQSMCAEVRDGNNREAKPIDSSVYLLNHVTVPAVIVECGFLSNSEETKLLTEAGYQKKLAAAICAGIVKYENEAE